MIFGYLFFFLFFFFFFFKQKTAYEIRLSLVGSEMCIRDRNIAANCGMAGDMMPAAVTSTNIARSQMRRGNRGMSRFQGIAVAYPECRQLSKIVQSGIITVVGAQVQLPR